MNPDDLRQFAAAAASQALGESLLFYGILLAANIVMASIAAFAGSYLSRRGETRAMAADLDAIKRQLRETTEVSEEVRAKVLHADWEVREWRLIRRTKLEELLTSALRLRRQTLEDRVSRDPAFIARQDSTPEIIEMTCRLYLPELTDEVYNLISKAYALKLWTGLAVQREARTEPLSADFIEAGEEQEFELQQAGEALLRKAESLMLAVAGPAERSPKCEMLQQPDAVGTAAGTSPRTS